MPPRAIRPGAPTLPATLDGVDDFMPDRTPVETHGDYRIKREDAWTYGGASGAKARAILAIATGRPGLISAGARISPQIERAALVAAALGIPARLHTGAGRLTAELWCAKRAGATLLQHNPARLSVIKARFRADAAAHPGWALIPYGMNHPVYLAQVAAETENLPAGPYRLVVPCGSGMTLAGILRGRIPTGVDIVAVRVGGEPKALDTYAPSWRQRCRVVTSVARYEDAVMARIGDVVLDPHYEAKCLPYLRAGDVLWAVGVRSSARAVVGRIGQPTRRANPKRNEDRA